MTPPDNLRSAARVVRAEELGVAGEGEGLLLGSLAILPLLVASIAVWLTPPALAHGITTAALGWSGALLAFLGGVRRGLTFSERGGAAPVEIAAMLWLFTLGLGVIWLHAGTAAILMALAGFASVSVLDAAAARRLRAPRYFALFRPAQMLAASLAMAALLLRHA